MFHGPHHVLKGISGLPVISSSLLSPSLCPPGAHTGAVLRASPLLCRIRPLRLGVCTLWPPLCQSCSDKRKRWHPWGLSQLIPVWLDWVATCARNKGGSKTWPAGKKAGPAATTSVVFSPTIKPKILTIGQSMKLHSRSRSGTPSPPVQIRNGNLSDCSLSFLSSPQY